MSAKLLLGAIVAGTAALLIAFVPFTRAPDPAPPPPAAPDIAWLTKDADAQIIGTSGGLGPLFAGITLGGPAPSHADRARIAAFAEANHVDIDFELAGDRLAAIRFVVTYGGCCGYEGADVLALRMGRPRASECCGCDKEWIDDWARAADDVHMHARVRFNKVMVRWEHVATLVELLARADGAIGASVTATARGSGDRWRTAEPGMYVLEVPYPFVRYPDLGPRPGLVNRWDLGVQARADRGRIVETAFVVRDVDREELAATMTSRWGRSRAVDDVRTWRLVDRTITADLDLAKITITARE